MVIFESETGRSKATQIAGAPLNLEYFVAVAADEMVMVMLPRNFIPRGFSREFYGNKPPLLEKLLYRPVNGSNTEPRDHSLGASERFFGGERPVFPLKNLTDGCTLPRFTDRTRRIQTLNRLRLDGRYARAYRRAAALSER